MELFLDFSDRVDALEWLETCHKSLFAVARQAHAEGLHQLTCEIVEAAWPLFTHRKLYGTWIESHQPGADAARAYGDVRMHARMLLGLAAAYNNLHEFDRATHHAGQALDLAQQATHREAEASALEILGVAAMATGRPDEAIELFNRSRTIHWQLNHPRGAMLMTRHIGEALAKAGRHDEAIEYFTAVLPYFTTDTEPYLRARALSGLANAHLHTGRLDEAEQALHESLSLCRHIDSHHEEADVLVMLAHLDQHHGDTTGWRSKLESALSIYAHLDAPEVAAITEQLEAGPTGEGSSIVNGDEFCGVERSYCRAR